MHECWTHFPQSWYRPKYKKIYIWSKYYIQRPQNMWNVKLLRCVRELFTRWNKITKCMLFMCETKKIDILTLYTHVKGIPLPIERSMHYQDNTYKYMGSIITYVDWLDAALARMFLVEKHTVYPSTIICVDCLQISGDLIPGEPLFHGTTEGDGWTSQDDPRQYPFATIWLQLTSEPTLRHTRKTCSTTHEIIC